MGDVGTDETKAGRGVDDAPAAGHPATSADVGFMGGPVVTDAVQARYDEDVDDVGYMMTPSTEAVQA